MCNATLPFYLCILPVLIDSNNLQILERWRQMTVKKLPVNHQLFPAWAYFLAERILSPVLKKKWKTKNCKMRFSFTRPVTNVFVWFPTDLESEIFPLSSLSEFHSFSFRGYLADPWIIQQREKFAHWKVKCSTWRCAVRRWRRQTTSWRRCLRRVWLPIPCPRRRRIDLIESFVRDAKRRRQEPDDNQKTKEVN